MSSDDISILPPQGSARRAALALMIFVPLAWGALAVWLGQSTAWDLRNYHWYNAYAYLNGRMESGGDFLPSQMQFFLNPWIDIPYYLLATHLPLRLATFILGAGQGLNFALLFLIAQATLFLRDPLRKTLACGAVALVGMTGAVGLSEAGTVFYDNITSLGILLSLLLLARQLAALDTGPWRQAAKIALAAGLPAGLVTGLKLAAAPWCLGIAVALVALARKNPRPSRALAPAFFFSLGAAQGFALAYGHWAWHLYSLYHSPLFPYFNDIFRSPYIPPQPIRGFAAPNTVMGQVLFPFLFATEPRLVIETDWRDWRIPVLYAAMFALAALRLARPRLLQWGASSAARPSAFLFWTAAVGYAGWLYSDATYRYLLPLEMLAPLLLVMGAGLLPLPEKARWAGLAALGLALALTVQPSDWGRRPSWPEQITEVTRPDLPDDPQLMILMAGTEAYAHMLPAFPPHINFVRIDNRAFSPASGWGIIDLIRARIAAHHGQFMLLAPQADVPGAQKALDIFGLKALPKSCREVIDRFGDKLPPGYAPNGGLVPVHFSLCDVRRR